MYKLKLNKKYTGIGSRKTPENILQLIKTISHILYKNNYILRSGGAEGADEAFESKIPENNMKEIYLPWKNFRNNNSTLYNTNGKAFKIASRYYTNWNKFKKTTKLLLARNIHQVLGKNLKEPSDFLICWTKNGKEIGGTKTGILIAKKYNIPIYNLFNLDIRKNIFKILKNYTGDIK